uniref:Secreted protein n=1 Tax=Ascaris lumbricoides TaxID=6252 RepID=A0A0M3HUA2_ASCLU
MWIFGGSLIYCFSLSVAEDERIYSTTNPLPKPPPAQWNGGGLTALIAAENGIDNTWEQYVMKQLPNTLRNFGHPARNPWSSIQHIVLSFLGNKGK